MKLNKYDQKNSTLPISILFLMSCYVIWQMGIIWLDANNSIISTYNLHPGFFSNLAVACVIVSVFSITTFTLKPNYAYKSCYIFSVISLITTVFLIFNKSPEACLYILVSSCSVMSISSLVIYFFTYNSKNLKKQIIFEMFGVAIINLIFHSDIVKLPSIVYNIVAFILLLLFIIGLSCITDLKIIFNNQKKEKNASFYIGITVLIIIFHIVAVFGANIINQIKDGNTIFYIGAIFGSICYYLLNKTKIKKTYIPTIYISLFLLSLAFFNINSLLNVTCFMLGMSGSLLFALPYYCNLVFKNTGSKNIYLIFNFVGISQVALMDAILSLTNNNIELLTTVYIIISIVALCIMFILNNNINLKIDKMLKLENKETVFKTLTSSEISVADLLLKGHTNSEIAEHLHLSLNTIKFHIKSIYKKLNINSKKELISLFEK